MRITYTVYKSAIYQTQWDSLRKETKYASLLAGSSVSHWCILRKDMKMSGTEVVKYSHNHIGTLQSVYMLIWETR